MALERKESGDAAFDGCEEALSFISVKEASGETVKITDLVQSLMLGTGPTVHRKVMTLIERGLIKAIPSKEDGRAKTLSLTKAGQFLLNERSKQMAQIISGK